MPLSGDILKVWLNPTCRNYHTGKNRTLSESIRKGRIIRQLRLLRGSYALTVLISTGNLAGARSGQWGGWLRLTEDRLRVGAVESKNALSPECGLSNQRLKYFEQGRWFGKMELVRVVKSKLTCLKFLQVVSAGELKSRIALNVA